MTDDVQRKEHGRSTGIRWDLVSIVLAVACIVLIVFVFLLARQNRACKAQISALAMDGVRNDLSALAAGDVIEPFDAVAVSGETTRIAFGTGEPRTLLLVFSSDCPACERTTPAWNRVLGRGDPSSLRILGIRADTPLPEVSEVTEETKDFLVYTMSAPLESIPYVPATVLLDAHGTVMNVWYGALDATQEAELHAAL